MWIKAVQIYIILFIVKENLTDNGAISQNEKVTVNLNDKTCQFEYITQSFVSKMNLRGNVTSTSFDLKCGGCQNVTDPVNFFKLCAVQRLEAVKLDTSLYLVEDKVMNSSSLVNLKDLDWNMRSCHTVNDILGGFKYLEILSITLSSEDGFNDCHSLHNISLSQLKQLHISVNTKYQNQLVNINESYFYGLRSLELFELNAGDNSFAVEIDINLQTFQSLGNLTEISIKNAGKTFLSRDHFKHVTNLKTLRLKNILIDSFHWISSDVLRNQLEVLEITNSQFSKLNESELMEYLQKYEKLKLIEVSENSALAKFFPTYKISAFICAESNICKFITDKDKKKCPDVCRCRLERKNMMFIINCSEPRMLREIPKLPIPITGNTSLDFNNQNLTILPSKSLHGYSEVRELHVANNQLSNLTVDQLPNSLTYLDLSGNRFKTLDKQVVEFIANRSHSFRLKLAGNPWICNCDNHRLILFLLNHVQIEDQEILNCTNPQTGKMINLLDKDLCAMSFSYTNAVFKILAVNLLILLIIFMGLKKKHLIIQWLIDHFPELESEIDKLKKDAFIAFSHKNLNLIHEYVRELEESEYNYDLCYYQRDWLIGSVISHNILESIEESRRIIILLTNNFVTSVWGRFEFQSAIKATSMNRSKQLIIVLYPEVDTSTLDLELRLYLKFILYLERDDPEFWTKLKRAMPYKRRRKQAEAQV